MVYLSKPDETIKFQVLKKSNDFSPDNKLYYWYWMNNIHSTQMGYSGELLHGEYTSYYSRSNSLKEKGEFKNGLKTGEWVLWYENGNQKILSNWEKGLLSGKFQEYDSNGVILKEFYYNKGELEGNQISYRSGKINELKKYKKGKEILPELEKEKKEPMGKIDKSEVKTSFWERSKKYCILQIGKIKSLFKGKEVSADEKKKENKINEQSKPKKMKPKERDFH